MQEDTGITERRKRELHKEGIDYRKIKERKEKILRELCEERFSIAEAGYLLKLLGHDLEEMTKHSSDTRLTTLRHMN